MKLKICILLFLSFSFFCLISAQDKPLVVCTASMIADLTREICGEEVEIRMIVPIGGDPHIYEPKPSDAQLAAKADLIFKNGLTFEGWLTELMENSGTKAKIVTVTEHIDPIQSQQYKGSSDPHAWMDVSLVAFGYIRSIKDALIELKPEAAEVFNFNYGVYKQQLEELDRYIKDQVETISPNKRVLITSHDAFQYYGIRYGIQLESVIGTSTDAQAQTSDIVRLQKVIKERQVPAVFIESTIDPKMLKQIASDNGAVVGGKLFADSLGDEESGADTYYNMMKSNTDKIVQALKRDVGDGHTETEESNNTATFIMYGILALLLVGGFLIVLKSINK